jgi:hypothetical protein
MAQKSWDCAKAVINLRDGNVVTCMSVRVCYKTRFGFDVSIF